MTDVSWLGPPIDVRPLFGEQQAAFTELLRQLTPRQWDQPTICPGWSVRDIAAHVLGDHIGRLSRHRDGYPAWHPRDGEAFPVFLDRINGEWVTAARRMSPRVLTEQLSIFGDQIAEFWAAVDPDALGGPVSWAGPGPVPVWLDAARDFSEYWTHQQQICDATGQAGLAGPRYLGPVLDTFMRACRTRCARSPPRQAPASRSLSPARPAERGAVPAARTAGGCSVHRTRSPPHGSSSTRTPPGGYAPAASLPNAPPPAPAAKATSTWPQRPSRWCQSSGHHDYSH